MAQSIIPTQSSAPVAPNPTATASGFKVHASVGGAGDPGAVLYGVTGHASLTVAGIAAVLTQAAAYLGGLASLPLGCQVQVRPGSGHYTVLTADVAAQHAAVLSILSTPANVTGNPS